MGIQTVDQALKHDFNATARFLAAKQAGRYDPRIVEHQQVALPQLTGQIGEPDVPQLSALPRDMQQPAIRAVLERLLETETSAATAAYVAGRLHRSGR